MTVSERIPFSGLLLPLQKGYTFVFASFNSIMVGVLMVAIAVYVCVGLPNMNPGQLVLADMFSSGTKLTALGAGIAVLVFVMLFAIVITSTGAHRRDVWRTDDAVLVCQLSGRYRAVHHPVLPAQKVSPCLPPRGLHDAAVGAVRHVRVRHRRGRVPVVFGAADAGRHGVAAAGHLRGGIRGVCT